MQIDRTLGRVMAASFAAAFIWAGTIITEPESFPRSVVGFVLIMIGVYAIYSHMGNDTE